MGNLVVILALITWVLTPVTCAVVAHRNFSAYQNKLNNIKIGNCYKKLGTYGYAKIIEVTENFVVFNEIEGTRELVLKTELLNEYYVKVEEKNCDDPTKRFD